AHPAEPGEGRDRRSHGGGCTARAGCGAARSAGGRAGLFPEGAGRSGRAGGAAVAPGRAAAQSDIGRTLLTPGALMTAARHLALAGLLVSTGCDRASGPKIALRFHPPVGAAYSYQLEQ